MNWPLHCLGVIAAADAVGVMHSDLMHWVERSRSKLSILVCQSGLRGVGQEMQRQFTLA